jgi:hypothetical protein
MNLSYDVEMEKENGGRIRLTDKYGHTIHTSATDLAYILQEFQEKFGGISVKIDPKEWRGMIGFPVKE